MASKSVTLADGSIWLLSVDSIDAAGDKAIYHVGTVQLSSIPGGINGVAAVLWPTTSAPVPSALPRPSTAFAPCARRRRDSAQFARTNEIANVLRDIYQAGVTDAVDSLVGLGFSVNVVAAAVQNAYGVSGPATLAAILKAMGQNASAVAGALHSVYNTTAPDAAAVLAGLGAGARDIASALRSVYSTTPPATAAAILQSLGTGSNDIAVLS